MNNNLSFILFLFACLFLFSNTELFAHGIEYQILGNKAVTMKVIYSTGEPLSFGNFEIFAPNEKIPHQKGRTDKNGFISFYPDKKGIWTIVVTEDTEHGMHKKVIEIKVDDLMVSEVKRDFTDKYLKIIAGLGFIMGIFGLIFFFKSKKRN
ncbi:MAG: hypothetical protein N2202_09805 [Proteobacteria bacterium]|nr:hypothetical protein [Pseudomonadota bacterium]